MGAVATPPTALMERAMYAMRLRGKVLGMALCGAEVATALCLAALIGACHGREAAFAALFGGAVAVVPTAYFAARVFVRPVDVSGEATLGVFYRAEIGKWLLTVVLFWFGAVRFGEHFAALITTCAACLAMNWILLAASKR